MVKTWRCCKWARSLVKWCKKSWRLLRFLTIEQLRCSSEAHYSLQLEQQSTNFRHQPRIESCVTQYVLIWNWINTNLHFSVCLYFTESNIEPPKTEHVFIIFEYFPYSLTKLSESFHHWTSKLEAYKCSGSIISKGAM